MSAGDGFGSAIWTLARKLGLPTNPQEMAKLGLEWLNEIKESLKALVTLDDKVRAARSLVAERAFNRGGFTSTALIPFRLEITEPSVNTDTYSTLYLTFHPTSGIGRYSYNGTDPVTGGAVGSGLIIPSGFSTLTIVGRENIRNFRLIAEGATNVLLEYQLYR